MYSVRATSLSCDDWGVGVRADNLAHGRVVQASKWASVCLLLLSGSLINRVRIFNLGWYFFPLKVALDTLFLSSLWTKLAEIWYTSPKFFAKSVHRRPINLVSDATFEAKKHQPKFNGRTLDATHKISSLICSFSTPTSCCLNQSVTSLSPLQSDLLLISPVRTQSSLNRALLLLSKKTLRKICIGTCATIFRSGNTVKPVKPELSRLKLYSVTLVVWHKVLLT